MADEKGDRPRDTWDKLEILLHPVGGLFTALAVAGVGFFGSQMLDRRQAAETNARLYSEIMSRREESETSLRKDMLVSVVQSYLQPNATELGSRVLNVELLAYNFHESINLKPLFLDLARQIRESRDVHAADWSARVQRLAREIASKQTFTLEAHGARFTRQFDYGPMLDSNKTVELEPEEVMIEGVASTIALRVLKVDPVESQLRVRLTVTTPRANQEPLVTRTEFSVGFYDLPMIDNTRLATGQRCAVTLTNFSRKDRTADLSVVCFPGEYASLKDRPYYDEVVRQLQRAGQAQ
ncbi:MAG: hypothetical protein U0V87_17010 [Acidobacteriota bacterium]